MDADTLTQLLDGIVVHGKKRTTLSPDDVELLESLGYHVDVVSISTLKNGKRICMVRKLTE